MGIVPRLFIRPVFAIVVLQPRVMTRGEGVNMDSAIVIEEAKPADRSGGLWALIIGLLLLLLGWFAWNYQQTGSGLPLPVPPPVAHQESHTDEKHSDVATSTSAAPHRPAVDSAHKAQRPLHKRSTPHGPSAKDATLAAAARPDLVWNYWLTPNPDAVVPIPSTAPLAIGAPQHMVFRLSDLDLARYFKQLQSLSSAPALSSAVAAGLSDPARHRLELDVLVQSTDEAGLRVDAGSRSSHLSIDLDAMRRAAQPLPSARSKPREAQLLAARLAQFGIDFTVLAQGSHEIGIAVVDAASGFPLQTMVATVAEQSTGKASVHVRGNGKLVGSGSMTPADLVLYLFDLKSRKNGINTPSLSAQLLYRTVDGRRAIVQWRTETDIEGLRDATRAFNAAVGSMDTGAALARAGEDFGRLLFGPGAADDPCRAGSDCDHQREARAILAAAANYAPGALPPTMAIGIVSGTTAGIKQFASDVLPFGAMGVSRDGVVREGAMRDTDAAPFFLGERFGLALLLSDQQFARTTACPSRWYFALPRAEDHTADGDPLNAALTHLQTVLGRVPPELVSRQSPDLGELHTWLSGRTTSKERSLVLAYIGHHNDGQLYLSENAGGIQSGSIQRVFERTSIAILNACSSAMSRVSSGTPIGRLALRHVDSTIATTSFISGELAGDYMDCLDAVLEDPRQLTVAQAHVLATQCLWSEASSARWKRSNHYEGAALKYMLIGDPNQPICSPRRGTAP